MEVYGLTIGFYLLGLEDRVRQRYFWEGVLRLDW